MKRRHPLTQSILSLVCSVSCAVADDTTAPAPATPAQPDAPARVPAAPNIFKRRADAPFEVPLQPGAVGNGKMRIQIQGGGGGGAVQLQNGAAVPLQGAVPAAKKDGANVQGGANVAPPAAVQLNIQGGAVQIQGGGQFQIQGGAVIQFQAGNAVVNGAATTVQANTAPDPKTQPATIFLPGYPTVLIHNPLSRKDPRPGYLGFTLDTGVAAEDADPKDKKDDGVGILSVIGDSPAEKAGLKEGDRVMTFEGKKATDHAQLREMIRATEPDSAVKLTVRRDGKEIELKAKLGAAPDAVAAAQLLGRQGFAQNGPEAVPGVVKFRNNGTLNSSSGISSTPKNAADQKDTVTLRDGNVFTGTIRAITAEKGVQLQRDGLADLELIEEEIASLTFAERKPANETETPKTPARLPKVLLQMRDGSLFNGDALTMDHGALQLTLPPSHGETEGKRIEIPREHAQFAAISEGDAPRIYDGPTGLAGWTSGRYSNGQWEYKDGFLRCVANGPIGRDLGRMPDPVDVSFDVNYPRHMQHFSFQLFTSDVNQSGVGALTIQFSPQQIFGSHFDGQRSNQYNTNQQPNAQLNAVFNAGDKAENVHYRVLVERVKGRALIYVNGEKRAEWKLSTVKPEDLSKCGGSFSITPHVTMSGMTFQIGRVRVMPWDGKEPQKEAERAEAKSDQLFAGDGKVTEGTIERITDGEVVFANPEAKTRRENTLFIRFSPPAAPKELPAAIATARLKNGSQINATKAATEGDAITLTTRSGPEVTVPLPALRELNFLPRAGQADVTAKNLDVLTLTDGTQFTGRALLPFVEKGVSWKIAASKTPLEFPSSKVAGVVFRSTEGGRKTAPMKGDHALKLANGDWLQGEVTSLNGKELVLKTDLAPGLKFPVSELRAIFLNPNVVGAVADGATGPDSWTDGWNPNRSSNMIFATGMVAPAAPAKSNRTWTYHDGSYTSNGNRGGQQMLTKRWPSYEGAYAIHFDVVAPGQSRSFNAQIFGPNEERSFSISASGTRLYVYYNPAFTRANRVGAPKNFQIENKSSAEGSTLHVSLIFDRPAKTFRVLLDGKEAGKLAFKSDEAKEALDACGFSVSAPTSYSSTTRSMVNGRISNLWLAPWTGAPAPTAAVAANDKPAGGTEPKKDTEDGAAKKDTVEPPSNVFLANGDEFAGTIEKLTSDTVTVNSEAGPLELPGKRVAWLRFPGTERQAAAHFPRLRFHDRGLLSVNDLQIADDRVKCKTIDGQTLDFPLNVVKEVVWRPLDGK